MRHLLLIPLLWITAALPGLAAPVGGSTELTLPNGILIVTQPWSGPELGDQVLLSFGFRGGVVEEHPSHRGLTHWLAQTLAQAVSGAITIPGDADPPLVAVELDGEYVAIQVVTSLERFPIHWPVALDLLRDQTKSWTLYRPDVQYMADELAPLQADGAFMTDLFARTLLLGNSPYVSPPLGTPPSLAGLKESDLQSWGTQLLQPDRLILSIVAPPTLNLEPLAAELALWERDPLGQPLSAVTLPTPTHMVEALRPMAGIVPTLSCAIFGPAVREPDLPAFLVAATALGDPRIGLFAQMKDPGPGQVLRVEWELERHAVASLATLQFSMDIDGDIFDCHDRVLGLLEEVALTGLSDMQIARAQGILQAALEDRRVDPVAQSSWLTTWSVWENLTAGRRLDAKITALTPAEVNAAMRKYFALDRVAIAGLAPNLPDDYYFPNDRDPSWGSFRRPRDRGLIEDPPLEHYDPTLGPPATDGKS